MPVLRNLTRLTAAVALRRDRGSFNLRQTDPKGHAPFALRARKIWFKGRCALSKEQNVRPKPALYERGRYEGLSFKSMADY